MCQRLGRWFAAQGRPPAEHVFACEVAPEIFQYEAVRCRPMGFDSVIPFPGEQFDLICAIEVLEHTARPYDFLAGAFTHLRPGGWLVFSVPNALHFQSRLKFLFTGFAEMFGPPSAAPANAGRICGHIMPLSYPHYVYGLRRAGFAHVTVTTDRTKRSALWLGRLAWPALRLGTALARRALRRYDPAVARENEAVVTEVNRRDLLGGRSCILLAQRPAEA
jgi:SAM-dependent methyltransferase